MKTVKSTAKVFAEIARFAAQSAGGGASWFGYCQPKERSLIFSGSMFRDEVEYNQTIHC